MELRIFLLIVLSYQTSARLELTVHPQTAKQGTNILIPCKFDVGKPVDTQFLAIIWYFQGKEILSYDDVVRTSHPRVSLNTNLITSGVASLSLSNVQISDNGIYKCLVVYSPEQKEKEVKVDVNAPPTITITNNVVVKNKESSLNSTITGFYPSDINIEWLRDKDVLEPAFHTAAQRNTDGTYSVNSTVTITPTEENNNQIYSIMVQHASLHEPLQKDFHLVYGENQIFPTTTVIFVLVGIFITAPLVIGVTYFILKCKKKGQTGTVNKPLIKRKKKTNQDPKAPEVEEIKIPELIINTEAEFKYSKAPEVEEIEIPELIINTEAEFKCKCSNYFPNDLQVEWRQKKGGRDFIRVNLGNCRIPVIEPIEQPNGAFTCTAILGFTPPENSEEELDFMCTVTHSALKLSIIKTTGPLTILDAMRRTMNKNIPISAEKKEPIGRTETIEQKSTRLGEVLVPKGPSSEWNNISSSESHSSVETAESETREASKQKTEDTAPENYKSMDIAYAKTREASNEKSDDLVEESETREASKQKTDDSADESETREASNEKNDGSVEESETREAYNEKNDGSVEESETREASNEKNNASVKETITREASKNKSDDSVNKSESGEDSNLKSDGSVEELETRDASKKKSDDSVKESESGEGSNLKSDGSVEELKTREDSNKKSDGSVEESESGEGSNQKRNGSVEESESGEGSKQKRNGSVEESETREASKQKSDSPASDRHSNMEFAESKHVEDPNQPLGT
ncbi:uncharacterized protein LOC128641803 [Bombina bombina]|uniref:uncharacterized protein LOC128641803 n=1 Tax=Bombina bombina TaxID=8345 RepID=UPI00235B23BF|nr:uncharacterized protein LOC128641803 [Bombina bombina]